MIYTHTAKLELPFPPPENLVEVMLTELKKHVPLGQELNALLGKKMIGPDLGSDFQPCYRMDITFSTVDIEPDVGYTVD